VTCKLSLPSHRSLQLDEAMNGSGIVPAATRTLSLPVPPDQRHIATRTVLRWGLRTVGLGGHEWIRDLASLSPPVPITENRTVRLRRPSSPEGRPAGRCRCADRTLPCAPGSTWPLVTACHVLRNSGLFIPASSHFPTGQRQTV